MHIEALFCYRSLFLFLFLLKPFFLKTVVIVLQEYVVEDVDGEISGSDWAPPPLPSEHVQQLKSLGLL